MAFFTWFGNLLGGGSTDQRNIGPQLSGPAYQPTNTMVTEDAVLSISAVYASIRLLSDSISTLPLHVYEKGSDGSSVISTDHWFAKLFAGKVNQYQTSTEFWQVVIAQLVLHGNAYVKIGKLGNKIISLLPLMSNQIEVILNVDGSITYRYSTTQGQIDFNATEVWHLKLRGNAIVGMSPLQYGQGVYGVATAASNSATKLMASGGKPAGVLSIDRPLKPSQRDEIRTNFSTLTDGEQQRLLVLEYGMTFSPISMSPEAVQLLESRKFSVEEVSRIFGIPLPLLNVQGGAQGTALEQMILGFEKFTMRPYLTLIENSIQANLFTNKDRQGFEAKFDTDELLRSTPDVRFAAYKDAILSSVLTPNEVRTKERRPPVEGGNVLLAPVNMTPIQKLGQNTNANTAPK